MRRQGVRIEPLSDHHSRAGFSCGVRRIDAYLADGLDLQAYGLSRIFVAVDLAGHEIRGYYALQARHVAGANVPHPLGRIVRGDARIPVMEVIMLAVDRRRQRQGIGSSLLADALRRVRRMAAESGIWAVVLDALDQAAEDFYRARGFDLLMTGTRTMYIAIASIG
jgi:GNAT superfamily N-acetyltransferase